MTGGSVDSRFEPRPLGHQNNAPFPIDVHPGQESDLQRLSSAEVEIGHRGL